jgi:integrase
MSTACFRSENMTTKLTLRPERTESLLDHDAGLSSLACPRIHPLFERPLSAGAYLSKVRGFTSVRPAMYLSRKAARVARSRSSKHVAVAKLFFGAAKKRRLLAENPFEGQASAIQPNRQRCYFVTREEAARVLDACPSVEWRLTFALSRFGRLRCPSEHLELRWQDVDWDRGRLTVHFPKTEHLVGHEYRTIPLFPELREILEEAFEAAEEGSSYVITRYRNSSKGSNVNLRTQLERILKRAGLTQWPRLFQNLRSTRQSELEESFPSHVVCSWMGNSRPIAERHYLQVTDQHFELATSMRGAAQNPARAVVTDGPNSSHENPGTSLNLLKSDEVVPGQNQKIAGAGLEPARGITLTGF